MGAFIFRRDDAGVEPGAVAPPPPPPPPPPLFRTRALLAFLTVSVLVLAGGVVTVFAVHTIDSRGGPVAGQLRHTYPTKPAPDWRLEAADAVPRGQFVRPDPTSYQYLRPGFIDLGDILISTVILPDTDAPPMLVAIESDTGAVRWKTPIDSYPETPSCATRTVDGMLPCIGGNSVRFIRVSDGHVDHQLVAGNASRVEVIDRDVITADYREMSRGTPDNLSAEWRTTYDIDPGCPGSGDSQQFGVTDRFVFFGSDAGAVVAAATDGHRVIDSELQAVAVYPGRGLVARRCAGDTIDSVVIDATGRQLRVHDGAAEPAEPWLVAPDDDGPYIVGNTAYDFTTGAQRWTAAGPAIEKIIGNIAIGTDVDADTMAAYDRRTGAKLWTTAWAGDPLASDGERVLLRSPDGLTAVDLSSGEPAWTSQELRSGSLAPVGDGFAVGQPDEIVYYPPTGGAAPALGVTPPAPQTPASVSEAGRVVTKCGRVPTMRPTEYRTDTGGLVVKMEVKASCPDGDIVSTNGMRITVTDHEQTVASAVFDFADAPMYLPSAGTPGSEGPVVQEFVYPVGSFWRLPNSPGSTSPSAGGASTTKAFGDQLVECEDQGQNRGPDSGEPPTPSVAGRRIVAARPAGPSNTEVETASLDGLRAQADADRPVVTTGLADRWVAQLSSKRLGLVAPDVDGRVVTWTAAEILNQHLRLRLRYPDVRLVWSDEWRTFDLNGWWITVTGITFPDSDAANSWCDSHGIPVDECFAKLISNTRDSLGTTKYRR